jgi:uncharacterized UPF0160 family protein
MQDSGGASILFFQDKGDMKIGTHSGCFQADEALGVWMLRRLDIFGGESTPVVRSRDTAVLEPLFIVIDVGGTYSHEKLRYDHHQRGFFETFDGAPGVATGPETATGVFKTKLSASGLVYKHYGREIISKLHPSLASAPEKLSWVYTKMYEDFMEGLDANDNGVEIADETRYKDGTTLPGRVHRLNAPWNAAAGGPSEDERFQTASAMCGEEFKRYSLFPCCLPLGLSHFLSSRIAGQYACIHCRLRAARPRHC